jgi:RNA polymerase sigma factor (sigma-70 family)
MPTDTTRATLLSRVRNPSDQAAWREFDARYGELILRYCGHSGLSHADAEDVRQNVMLRLSRVLRDFHYSPEKGRFRSFLGTMVRNEIARHLGRPHRGLTKVSTDDLAATLAAGAPADAQWEQEWMHHHLRLAMRSIRRTYEPRSVAVFERLMAGEDPARVAAALGTSPDAIRKIKERIRDRLKVLVATQIQDEPGIVTGIRP